MTVWAGEHGRLRGGEGRSKIQEGQSQGQFGRSSCVKSGDSHLLRSVYAPATPSLWSMRQHQLRQLWHVANQKRLAINQEQSVHQKCFTLCKSVVPLDNSAFDPTLRGGERVLRRWQQYWECFLTLNILNDCFKYHSSEHGLKTNKTETYSKIACNIKALSHTSNRNIPCIFGRK